MVPEPAKLSKNFVLPRPTVAQVTILDPKLSSALQSDTFRQTQGLLDVVWVVANTGVMKNERDVLAADLPSFTSVLTGAKVGWQLGVTSSDLSVYRLPDGSLHTGDGGYLHGPIITPQDSDPGGEFATALNWDIERPSAPSDTSVFASMQLAVEYAQPGGPGTRVLSPAQAPPKRSSPPRLTTTCLWRSGPGTRAG